MDTSPVNHADPLTTMRQPDGGPQVHKSSIVLESLREENVLTSHVEPMALTPPASRMASPAMKRRTVDFDGLCLPGNMIRSARVSQHC